MARTSQTARQLHQPLCLLFARSQQEHTPIDNPHVEGELRLIDVFVVGLYIGTGGAIAMGEC